MVPSNSREQSSVKVELHGANKEKPRSRKRCLNGNDTAWREVCSRGRWLTKNRVRPGAQIRADEGLYTQDHRRWIRPGWGADRAVMLSAGKHAQKAFCGKRKRITLRTHMFRSNVTVKAYGSCSTLLASLKIVQVTLQLLRIVWKYPFLTIFFLGLCVLLNILLIILLLSIKVT